jgi:predicted dehydrogenase
MAQAARLTDPRRTVVHLCTPPDSRVALLDELGRHGFRHVLVEKPLALDHHDITAIRDVRGRWQLRLIVVAPWLASTLTDRIRSIVEGRELGALRAIYIIQRKPRFTRSVTPNGHPTAFDVEMPHSVSVALSLAGPARLGDAALTDMSFDNLVLLRMGSGLISLEHESGVRTEIRSDLTSLLRERRITLVFERGSVVGNYPASEADHAAQLVMTVGLRATRAVFYDDAMTALVLSAYDRFAAGDPCDLELDLHGDVVRLLSEAKWHCERQETGPAEPEVASGGLVARNVS